VLSPHLPDLFRSDEIAEEGGGASGGQAYRKMTDVFTTKSNMQIVADDSTIKLPPGLLLLTPDEFVIDSISIIQTIKFWDWVKIICTFGLAYLFVYRKRKYSRTAVVLTNLRVLVADIYQRDGVIPPDMANFSVTTRSFLFHEILAGSVMLRSYIGMWQMIFSWCLKPFMSEDSYNYVEAGLLCPSGVLLLKAFRSPIYMPPT
jgi:hypothetical protein